MGCASSRLDGLSPAAQPLTKSHVKVERVIGQGGFGRVEAIVKTKGFDANASYAMKTLSKAVILSKNHVAMVMNERNLLAKLHCPQLVNMHYAFQDTRRLFIVMDLCLGGDLHYQLTQLPARCFPEDQARFYVANIVLCLEYMHSARVLHRDIKPENLLLDERGWLKVTDLGVSSEVDEDGVCTATSGTRPYMAPEVFMSGHAHTFTADYYSLGITTFQLLLGHRPYKPDSGNMKSIVRASTFVAPDKYTDLAQIRRILINAQERKATSPELRFSLKLGPHVSPEAVDFVQHCLICNPTYRLGSEGPAEVKAHPWFAGIDWDEMARQTAPVPFVPNIQRANCNVVGADIGPDDDEDEELDDSGAPRPPISAADQAKFAGYDYRTRATDSVSGRTERVQVSPRARRTQPEPGKQAQELSDDGAGSTGTGSNLSSLRLQNATVQGAQTIEYQSSGVGGGSTSGNYNNSGSMEGGSGYAPVQPHGASFSSGGGSMLFLRPGTGAAMQDNGKGVSPASGNGSVAAFQVRERGHQYSAAPASQQQRLRPSEPASPLRSPRAFAPDASSAAAAASSPDGDAVSTPGEERDAGQAPPALSPAHPPPASQRRMRTPANSGSAASGGNSSSPRYPPVMAASMPPGYNAAADAGAGFGDEPLQAGFPSSNNGCALTGVVLQSGRKGTPTSQQRRTPMSHAAGGSPSRDTSGGAGLQSGSGRFALPRPPSSPMLDAPPDSF